MTRCLNDEIKYFVTYSDQDESWSEKIFGQDIYTVEILNESGEVKRGPILVDDFKHRFKVMNSF